LTHILGNHWFSILSWSTFQQRIQDLIQASLTVLKYLKLILRILALERTKRMMLMITTIKALMNPAKHYVRCFPLIIWCNLHNSPYQVATVFLFHFLYKRKLRLRKIICQGRAAGKWYFCLRELAKPASHPVFGISFPTYDSRAFVIPECPLLFPKKCLVNFFNLVSRSKFWQTIFINELMWNELISS
jgi:hypothetical protein